MKKPTQHLIAEVPRKRGQVELTIGIDLGDVWSHYRTLNQQGEVIDRGRFRTTPKPIDTWFTYVPHARVAMEAGVHSIWISEQLEQLGHEVIVANVRELRAISHCDRKSDDVDAEKLARYACLDPEILDSGFSRPNGIAVDGSGNVFVADSGNNTVKEIDLTSPRPRSPSRLRPWATPAATAPGA
ncbi:IS110 family transposase [Terriglobus tenax]|uniref:IS110 family transposase n=1 Tax=Terriglobus tenax TaxID=1111115 RepID=UPI0021DFCFFD|nr:transposase [Terriglobus tenax]